MIAMGYILMQLNNQCLQGHSLEDLKKISSNLKPLKNKKILMSGWII